MLNMHHNNNFSSARGTLINTGDLLLAIFKGVAEVAAVLGYISYMCICIYLYVLEKHI